MTTVWALHGAVGMAADWRGLAGSLAAAGVGCRALDLWRFLDCCPLPLAAFGAALNEEARAVPGPRVLLGYSLGGRLALHALLAEPQLWDAAVIVAAHPGLVSEAERVERRGRDAGWAAAALKDEWGGFLREWEAQEIFRGGGAAPGDRRLLAPRRAAVARSFIDWSLGAQADLTPRLAAVATPVTWVVGERDGKFRAAGERAVAALGCGALVVLDGCGHRVAWERPGEFAALVAGVAARING